MGFESLDKGDTKMTEEIIIDGNIVEGIKTIKTSCNMPETCDVYKQIKRNCS